jgi:integrase
VWSAVYNVACVELQDAMDMNYLTGQRPADVLKMRLSDIKGGAIEVQQNKTKKKLRILLDDEGARAELGKVIDRIKGRERKVASLFLIATPTGTALNRWTLRTRFDDARDEATKRATESGDDALSARICASQFRDIRPKAASEMDLEHASKLLGHTDTTITEKVYRRIGETVKPTK